jgi:EAL domain-containing protein (putative c-di-GMP-specific phosphodiesterase class I)
VSAEQIHLEVTEQSIADFALLENQINRLRNRGFQFVLDDYGSGYSNLTRVKHYPFVNVKLDMEVVWDYFRDRDPLIPTIVQGFRQTGFSITAEGIETEEMADALTAIGCEFLQGYLFDKPLEMATFVAKYRIR